MRREIKKRKRKKINHHVELLSLIFILTLMVVIMMFSLIDRYKISQEKREEYVDALKESKIAEIIGILDTSVDKKAENEVENTYE